MNVQTSVQTPAQMSVQARVTVVVLTHNRPQELMRTLQRLSTLPEQPRIVVVDNGSETPVTPLVVRQAPLVEVVRSAVNLGAAGRNLGVTRVRTPYVAFCDDDTWYEPGGLLRAADLLDRHPRIGALAAQVYVEPGHREDPACDGMAHSPLAGDGLPGPALISFMAGAVVMRTAAFRDVGGYEPRLFLGAEEALMGLDLAANGWQMVYAPEVAVCHHPSTARDPARRYLMLTRNRLWIAWLRLPLPGALRETRKVLREAARAGLLPRVLRDALVGLPWVLSRRKRVPREVYDMHRRVFAPQARS